MAFGDFTTICLQTSFPLCPLVGPPMKASGGTGIMAICYARSVEIANTIIFEAATDAVHIVALIMTTIMVVHVRSKFTAVGRREITLFFYLYMALTILSLVLDAGVMTAGTGAYSYLVAMQNGLASALCTCLMINGFVGFQLYEDGTSQSVWTLRGASLVMFLVTAMVSIFTFQGLAGLSPTNTAGLFVVLYVMNAFCLLVYVVMQILLVMNTLEQRWPLGDLIFGLLFFVCGQVNLYAFGAKTCIGTNHYLDSLFFATIGNLVGVMMIYKYWDTITMEDLEFSVAMKQGQWTVKDQFSGDSSTNTVYKGSTTTHSMASKPPPPYPSRR